MDMITQTEQEPTPAERARDYLDKADPVDRMPPSRLMLDLRLARTHIEILLREISSQDQGSQPLRDLARPTVGTQGAGTQGGG